MKGTVTSDLGWLLVKSAIGNLSVVNVETIEQPELVFGTKAALSLPYIVLQGVLSAPPPKKKNKVLTP